MFLGRVGHVRPFPTSDFGAFKMTFSRVFVSLQWDVGYANELILRTRILLLIVICTDTQTSVLVGEC